MENSRYWLDILCQQIINRHKNKEQITIASGVTPSGPYHIGHIREILTAEAIHLNLTKQGFKTRHIHFIDSFDALRKQYPFLPDSYKSYIGSPLNLIPSPVNPKESYAKYYFKQFANSLPKLGIDDIQTVWMHEYYQQGKMAEMIELSLTKRDQLAKILSQFSSREIDKDWQPVQVLDKSNNSLRGTKFIGFDQKKGLISYVSADGNTYQADIKKGEVKLDWRVDWPARWQIFGIDVEPFGREHASKGGSFDTGAQIAKQIFNILAPLPVPYENINLKGQTKKMSSSVGNLVSIDNALKIIPPEILRYFVLKSRPEKQLSFDPGIGMYNLIDEFDRVAFESANKANSEFDEAYKMSVLKKDKQTISKIPFSHLVSSYQAALKDNNETLVVLERSGYSSEVKNQKSVILKQLGNVKYWLDNYAPDNVKFTLQKTIQKANLSKVQKELSAKLAALINSDKNLSAQALHDSIYSFSLELGLKPSEGFKTIYQLFLNQDWGPKAGYFLVSLDKDFLINRLELKA